MNFTTAKLRGKRSLYLLLFIVSGVILFIPIINKYFVSDDFLVLKRVCLDKELRIQGFFRPLSDISLYVNFRLGGFNPVGYNLFNILIHCFNSYLLFIFCSKWKWTPNHHLQHSYALMAAFLFLTYPFHSEAVAWTLGRGSSLAGTFGIAALVMVVSGWNNKITIFGACVCYFIGLMAYESIIMLPALIFILLIKRKAGRRIYITWALALSLTSMVHLLFRYGFSGAILGAYGKDLLESPLINYPGNILKVIARLIIPPIKNSNTFLIISVVAGFITGVIVLITLIKFRHRITHKYFIAKLLTILGCTLLIPFLFAVSTKTSESDRFLYFPSFFLCCFISFLLNSFIKSNLKKQLIFISLCIYNVLFLELTNVNWMKAGASTQSILHALKLNTGNNKICIANLPDEINGAYIFRHGFGEALLINRIDTSRVTIVNRLGKEAGAKISGTLQPIYYKSKVFIPPFLEINIPGQPGGEFIKHPGMIYFTLPPSATLYYWNQDKFVLMNDFSNVTSY